MDELNESTKLLISVLAPLLIVFPIVVYQYIRRHKDRRAWSYFKFCRSFDANHGLGSQPWFSMAIIYPIGLFFSTGYWAWSGLDLKISADGFKLFLEVSKLPLGLLALSIPLAVLTARLHGTKQTALQIKKTNEQITITRKQIHETQQKNKTDLYLAHYKYFSECILAIENQWDYSRYQIKLNGDKQLTINKKLCYGYLYPNSSLTNGIGNITSRAFDKTVTTFIKLLEEPIELIESKNNRKKEFRDYFVNSSIALKETFNGLFFNELAEDMFSRRGYFPITSSEVCFISSIEDLVRICCFIEGFLHEIYNFDVIHDQTVSQEFQQKVHSVLGLLDNETYIAVELYLNRTGNGIKAPSELDWSELESNSLQTG